MQSTVRLDMTIEADTEDELEALTAELRECIDNITLAGVTMVWIPMPGSS